METIPVLVQAREKFINIARENGLLEDHIRVTSETLSPQQAIGNPQRDDYPLLKGKEVIVEAEFRGSFGQAFTGNPRIFEGSLKDVMELPEYIKGNSAILIATLNAVMKHLGRADRVRHCKNEEPEKCAVEMAGDIQKRFGNIKIGVIGYQPAILENVSKIFGAGNIKCTDLNVNNIGTNRFGLEIWDGSKDTAKLIGQSDLVLATSSSLSNNTFDGILRKTRENNKKLIVFGITGAGTAALLGIERLCFYGH